MTSSVPVQIDAGRTETRPAEQLFATLADGRRRRVLALLRERRVGVTDTELATLVASAEAEVPLRSVSDEQHERVLVSLQHSHLPALESAGLVEHDGTTARPVELDVSGHATVETILDIDAPAAATTTTLDLLASERRRIVLQYLQAEGTATVDELVGAVGDADDRRNVRVSLVHTHLPKLAAAGVIAENERGEERYVVYDGLPIDEARLDSLLPDRDLVEPDDASGTVATDAAGSDIRTLEGQEEIVAHGQALFDRADDELFVMITTDGLLEPGCLDRLRDALDRGVDVFVGSQTRSVRDAVREEVPDATIWEPQRNWLDLPVTRDRLGRLVLADREAAMLGTIGETGSEHALADSDDGPLVILLRELLGERPDHPDGQSEDVRSRLLL